MSSPHSPRGGFGHAPREGPLRARRYDRQDREQSMESAEEKAKKDAMLEEKMKAIRKKNEELIKRQQEIEEDRRNADRLSDQLVKQKSPEKTMAGVATDKTGEPRGMGRARGRVLARLSKERLKATEWEEKRRKNIEKVEEEQRKMAWPSTAGSNFLHDDRRVDMSKVTGRTERSWGGSNFNNVRSQMERDRGRQPRGGANPEIRMTGKERREYMEWREERKRIDEDRKERAKRSGNWSREWDKTKVYDSKNKAWLDEEGDDAFDWSYNRQERRREPAQLREWMGHHNDRESSSKNFRSRRVESWEDEEREQGGRRRRSDKRGSSSSDDWKENTHSREPRGSQARSRGASGSDDKRSFSSHHHRERQHSSEDWGESCGDGPSPPTQAQPVHHKRESQPSVAPVSEDWGESVSTETEHSKVDRKHKQTRHINEEPLNIPSTSEYWGANVRDEPTEESNLDKNSMVSWHAVQKMKSENDKQTLPENSNLTATKREAATCDQETQIGSGELVEDLTISTISDDGRVVVSQEKEGAVAAEPKEQRVSRHDRRKLQKGDQKTNEVKGHEKNDIQFDAAVDDISTLKQGENSSCPQTSSDTVETAGSPDNMTNPDTSKDSESTKSSSMLQEDNTLSTTSEVSKPANVDTNAVTPSTPKSANQVREDTSSDKPTYHARKHPEPLKVSTGRKSFQEETESKEGAVPTTPDFLKPSYTDPKIDWGEYMEEIEEETAQTT